MYPVVLHDKNVTDALEMLDRFGPATLILSRFLPVFNLPSFIAGVNVMEYRRYMVFNLISSAVWAGILLMLGFYVGKISLVSQYLDYVTDLFIVVLAAAIIIALVMFIRGYVRRNGNSPRVK